MKLLIKLKDGSSVANDIGEDFNVFGQGNLLELLKKGKENNQSVTLDTQHGRLEKKFSDIYSIEIVIAN